MISVRIVYPKEEFKKLRQEIERAPVEMQKRVDAYLNRLPEDVLRPLKKPPGPVVYPIRWRSERQRRAFFATNGFGKGIPYRRTGQLTAGWKLRRTGNQYVSSLSVTNDVPYARFVQGVNQQPFHANTGWIRADLELEYVQVRVEATISRLWLDVATGRKQT